MSDYKLLLLGLAGLLIASASDAARLSEDATGQVLLFPQFLAGSGWETTIRIKNTDDERARAVRVVFKEGVNGRPTGAVNIYLTPGDSWEGTVKDVVEGAFRSFQVAEGRLALWEDDSCTFPSRDSLPSVGLMLNDDLLDESFGDVEVPNRTSSGFVEVYEMGTLLPVHAADCAAVSRRFNANGGAWFDSSVETLRNRAIGQPRGGLQGRMSLINVDFGAAFHMDALVIEDFSDRAMHTHPDFSRRPSLMDVNPAVSSRFVERLVGGQIQKVRRDSNWSYPVHAIDALLMTTVARADYHSESFEHRAFLLMSMPTAPYHNDADGFYLEGVERVSAPFSEQASLGQELNAVGPPVEVVATNTEGETFNLMTSGGNSRCEELRGALTGIDLSNIINFTQICSLDEAELRIPGVAIRGEVNFTFSGEIVSDESDVFQGLPVFGNMFQLFRSQNGINSHGWAQALKRTSGAVAN
jgi:hypothetical protein